MEWENEKCLLLVSLYEGHPELWQPNHKLYFNKIKKNDAWEAIATQLETTYDTVKSKITSLLASFRREKNKEETSKGTGKGADEIYRSKWFAYEAFGFLKDKNKFKETINSCTSQNASKENDSQVELIQEEDDNTSESASQITQTLPHQQSQEIRSASSQTALGFAKPTPMKRKRTPASPRSQVDEVVGILHNAVRRDACDVYGEHVAMKLKSYSKRTQAFVQHHVNNILFEADMGRYDELPHQNHRFISSVSPNYSASPSPATTFSSANSGPPSPAILLHPQQTTPEYSGDSTSPLSSLPTYHHLEPQPPTTDHSHQSSSDDADPLASVFASDPGTGVPSEAGTFFSSFC
ncbi:uncharacterized protein LOC124372094 [Homalodisca vitripennis]|uniref:uncharacterized protein LOC124372094 n=1 Tax=Homalodisca vitripennis TaxID=197043 RepID=UPI001EEA0ADF|nr:uncharacterized protein LOC124372094 [Homalodisca vitripennis]